MSNLDDVSIFIKTLERKDQLINLLHSIQLLGFKGPVLIADDSISPYGDEIVSRFPKLNIVYLSMEYDSGTSAGRNLLLKTCKTKYFVLCDDDFIFEPRTRIPLMLEILIENDLDLLGGVFREYWSQTSFQSRWNKLAKYLWKLKVLLPPLYVFDYSGNIKLESKICCIEDFHYNELVPYTKCDVTHNFFIAKTKEVLSFGGWNPVLKGGEHHNFFLRAKFANLRIGVTRVCGVIHDRQFTLSGELYKSLRARDSDFQKIALQEFDLIELNHHNGSSYKI